MTEHRKTIRRIAAGAALVTTGALGVAGASSASADSSAQTSAVQLKGNQPPQGARATVHVSPNPTAKRGEEITITGDCGGGTGLKQVIGGSPENPILENVRILQAGPDKFVAKATLAQRIGNGVGPVMVDCGGEAGVTLLVTHV